MFVKSNTVYAVYLLKNLANALSYSLSLYFYLKKQNSLHFDLQVRYLLKSNFLCIKKGVLCVVQYYENFNINQKKIFEICEFEIK